MSDVSTYSCDKRNIFTGYCSEWQCKMSVRDCRRCLAPRGTPRCGDCKHFTEVKGQVGRCPLFGLRVLEDETAVCWGLGDLQIEPRVIGGG